MKKMVIFWITLGVFFILLLLLSCQKKEKDNTDSNGLSVNQLEEVYNGYKATL